MPFLLMVFLTLACLPPDPSYWPAPSWLGPFAPEAAWLAWVAVAVPVAFAWFLARRLIGRLRRHPGNSEDLLRRYERGRRLHHVLLYSSFLAALCLFGWGDWVGAVWKHGTTLLPGAELLLILPFVSSLLLSWLCFYDADLASYLAGIRVDPSLMAREAAPENLPSLLAGRWTYLGYQIRQRLALVFLPLGLLLLQKELARRTESSDLQELAGLVSVVLLVVAMPWAVRLLLGLRPLPDGPLRQRFLALARRLNFRYSDFLVWDTGNGIANAMVVGLLPWPRYVVFTDRLLDEFNPDEAEAVLGHEIGHIRHHHMLLYLGFLTASLAAIGAGLNRLEIFRQWLELQGDPESEATFWSWETHAYLRWLPLVAAVLAYIFVVFGYLSRRCERQADVIGCRAVSCKRGDCQGHDEATVMAPGFSGLCPTGIQTFIRALERVAILNGINRDRPGFLQSWQHSTIGRRVAFLEGMQGNPTVEPRFQRGLALVKVGLFLALGVLFALAVGSSRGGL
jgi:STE24 endopeptidase